MRVHKFLLACLFFATSEASEAGFQEGFAAYEGGDYATALREWRPLAEQGDVTAQYNLGVIYANGRGVTKNAAEAVHWYQKAADQGDASAQNNLGAMYASGEGLDKNFAWAVYWQALAAQKGNTLAADNIELNLAKLTRLTVIKDKINIRSKPSTSSNVLVTALKNSSLFRLGQPEKGWLEVYSRTGHTVGYVADFLVSDGSQPRVANNSGLYPAAPAPDSRPGYVSCRTRCNNGDCYRTYSDGRKTHFRAQQRWDPFQSTWTWDSGSC